MKPTIGRIVHYFETQGGPYAAIITRVHSPECVCLSVFGLDGAACVRQKIISGPRQDTDEPYWHWPPIEVTAVQAAADRGYKS